MGVGESSCLPHSMVSFWFLVVIFCEAETQLHCLSLDSGRCFWILPFLSELGLVTFSYWQPNYLGWGRLYFNKAILFKEGLP